MAVQKLSAITLASTFGQTDTLVGVSGANADLRYSNAQVVSYAGTINVKDYGAKGDGTTDDTTAIQNALNAAFGVAGSIAQTAQRRVIFPPGLYIVTGSGLTGTNWFGGVIQGSGRFTTKIQNSGGGPVITTNGCQYMRFEDLQLDGNGGTNVLFDLDWTNTGTALQSNTFFNMEFSNAGTGLRIANSGFMGSENLILNCFFSNCSSRGIRVVGANALQQTMIGGNIQNCGIGINVNVGSFNVISGVGFQQSGTYDVQIDGAAQNTMIVTGCRTESPNFINNAGGQSLAIDGCHQTSAGSRGIFYTGAGGVVNIRSCLFDGQVIPIFSTRLCVQTCNPIRETVNGDWLVQTPGPSSWWWVPNNNVGLLIELENIIDLAGTTYVSTTKQRIFTTDGTTVTTQNYLIDQGPVIIGKGTNSASPATGTWNFLNSGLFADANKFIALCLSGLCYLGINVYGTGNVSFGNNGALTWTPATAFNPLSGDTSDTGVSRSAAGVVALGNGTHGDGSATILAKTKAGAPTTADVPAGTWALIRDTTNSTTKIYYNNAGTLQTVALV